MKIIKQKETNRIKNVKKWMSGKPGTCDICGHEFDSGDKYFYDFKTPMGPCGLGCEKCFKDNNGQLGIGYGQKYNLKTLEKIA
jgi:hypothetical protein